MSYDPPTGRELQILKRYQKLDEACCSTSMGLDPGSYDFALKGVRTNGTGHITTLSTYRYHWNKELAEVKKEMASWARRYMRLQTIHAQFEQDIHKYFETCSKCRGKGGNTVRNQYNQLSAWEDCYKCDGRGLIER